MIQYATDPGDDLGGKKPLVILANAEFVVTKKAYDVSGNNDSRLFLIRAIAEIQSTS